MKPALLLAALPLAAVALLATPAHAGGINIDIGFVFGRPHCAPPPVIVERPVVVERQVVVERPVVCERPVVVERPVCERPVVIERPVVYERPVVVERPVCERPVVIERPLRREVVVVRDDCHGDHWYRHDRWDHRDYHGCR